ncbi:unnamed protein product [Cochlearia groenlandica]
MEELRTRLIISDPYFTEKKPCAIKTLTSSFNLHSCEPTPQAYIFRNRQNLKLVPEILNIDALCRIGEGYSSSFHIFGYVEDLRITRFSPDLRDYTSVMRFLTDVEKAIKMTTSMKKLDCEANVVTYNILIKALVKSGDMSRAKSLLGRDGEKWLCDKDLMDEALELIAHLV